MPSTASACQRLGSGAVVEAWLLMKSRSPGTS
jgi:hypothetical protein